MFRRFFCGKRIGTALERYGTVTKWKGLKRYKLQTLLALGAQCPSVKAFDLVTLYIRRSVHLFTCGA